MFVDPSFNYGGWVELYNPTNKVVSLNNLYVSDDATNLTKYNLGRDRGIIPAKGFHVLWLDHSNDQFPAQIDFKLDYDGVDVEVYTITGRMVLRQLLDLWMSMLLLICLHCRRESMLLRLQIRLERQR